MMLKFVTVHNLFIGNHILQYIYCYKNFYQATAW